MQVVTTSLLYVGAQGVDHVLEDIPGVGVAAGLQRVARHGPPQHLHTAQVYNARLEELGQGEQARLPVVEGDLEMVMRESTKQVRLASDRWQDDSNRLLSMLARTGRTAMAAVVRTAGVPPEDFATLSWPPWPAEVFRPGIQARCWREVNTMCRAGPSKSP